GINFRLWDLATGRCLHTFEGHTEMVWGVAFSPNSHSLLSASGDKTIKVWQLASDWKAPLLVSRVGSAEKLLAADASFRKALTQVNIALEKGDKVKAARAVRQARTLPGFTHNPEGLEIWQDLYLSFPHKGCLGGWEAKTLRAHVAGERTVSK